MVLENAGPFALQDPCPVDHLPSDSWGLQSLDSVSQGREIGEFFGPGHGAFPGCFVVSFLDIHVRVANVMASLQCITFYAGHIMLSRGFLFFGPLTSSAGMNQMAGEQDHNHHLGDGHANIQVELMKGCDEDTMMQF